MNDLFESTNSRFLQVYVMYDKISFCPEFERLDDTNGDCGVSSGSHFISQDFGHHSGVQLLGAIWHLPQLDHVCGGFQKESKDIDKCSGNTVVHFRVPI